MMFICVNPVSYTHLQGQSGDKVLASYEEYLISFSYNYYFSGSIYFQSAISFSMAATVVL